MHLDFSVSITDISRPKAEWIPPVTATRTCHCSILPVCCLLLLVCVLMVVDWTRWGLLRSMARAYLPASTLAYLVVVAEYVRDVVATHWDHFEAATVDL